MRIADANAAISHVDQDGVAAAVGLEPGDVIMSLSAGGGHGHGHGHGRTWEVVDSAGVVAALGAIAKIAAART